MPFMQATPTDELYRYIAHNNIPGFLAHHPATRNIDLQDIDMEVMGLIFSCLQVKAEMRPTIQQL